MINEDRLKQKLQDIANTKVRYGDIHSFNDMSKEMVDIRTHDSTRVYLARALLKEFFGENK